MGGDGSQRRILEPVAEETEQHIESVESERGIYPRTSVDGVIADRDEKSDKGQSTSEVE